MASPKNAVPAPDFVEVRVTAMRYINNDGEHARGTIIRLARSEYDATCEVRDGERRPSHSFALISEERAVVEKKQADEKANLDRFMTGRQAAIESQEALEHARARQRAEEARSARQLADETERRLKEVTEPLERPGAARVA